MTLSLWGCASSPTASQDPPFSKQKSHRDAPFNRALTRLCLQGEGSGRLKADFKHFAFEYESLLTAERWSLGLYLPLSGEELFHLDYAKPPLRLSGSFAKRLLQSVNSAKETPYYRQLLKNFLQKVATVLRLASQKEQLRDCAPQAGAVGCQDLQGQRWVFKRWGESLKIEQSWQEHLYFTLEADSPDQRGQFERLTLRLEDRNPSYLNPRVWQLRLDTSQCSE